MKKNNPKKISKKIGLPPGSIVYTGAPKEGDTGITLISYNEESFSKFISTDLKEVTSRIKKNAVNWINFDSLHNTALIEEAGKMLNIHHLLLEDILDVGHQPKIEEFDDYLFLTLKTLKPVNGNEDLRFEQMSLVLGHDLLLTFQEHTGDPFEPIRERLEAGKGKARGRTADYLFILLVDAIVDQYFFAEEFFDKEISEIEIELFEKPGDSTVNRIINQKKELNLFKKEINPIAEGFRLFLSADSEFIRSEFLDYFKDINDHLKQIIDSINSQRESLTSMMEFYMIRISNQMNQVMKTLTVIATIFIPLTFIVGVYGMNFRYMPELDWKWSYPILMLIMLAVGILMYQFMRKRKWF
jgi:magnesium transporter